MADQDPQKGKQSDDTPDWIDLLPEDRRQEARDGWLRQADYTKKTQSIAEQKKEYDTLKAAADKHGHPEEWGQFWQKAEPYWNQFQDWHKQQQAGTTTQGQQNTQASQQQGAEYWKNWDLMQPDQQARQMADHVGRGVRDAIEREYAPQIQQAFQNFGNYLQNYMGLWRRAFDMKTQNPEVDLDELFRTATDVQSGKADILDVASRAMQKPEDLAKRIEDEVNKRMEQTKAQWEEEYKAKQTATTPPGLPQTAFQPREDAAKTAAEAKDRVARKVMEKYGPGSL